MIRKQVKQRQDSIESFEKSGRTELAEKEKAEVAVLNSVTASGDERGELQQIVAETHCNRKLPAGQTGKR